MAEVMDTIVAKVPHYKKVLFAKTANEIGSTPSAAIRMFIESFIEEGGFPYAPKKKRRTKTDKTDYRPIPHLDKIPRIKLKVGSDGIVKLPKGVFEPWELKAWSM